MGKNNKNAQINNEEILICACHSTEHQIVIQKDKTDNVVYCSIHLAPLPWYKRIVNGIKYIFGYRCKYGDFDEFMFDKKHIKLLKQITQFIENND